MNNYSEIEKIKQRYQKRNLIQGRYEFSLPSVYMAEQEKERRILNLFREKSFEDFYNKKLLEIGGGNGHNILNFIKFGFKPANICFNELMQDRFDEAVLRLPSDVHKFFGDAMHLSLEPQSFDIIFQSTVFTSILDSDFKKQLAFKMWNWLKPGGAILWYDFIYNNPKNKDVRGIPEKEIRLLFPESKIDFKKLTLAPPINRLVTKVHPNFYNILNMFPFLKTHVLCWIEK